MFIISLGVYNKIYSSIKKPSEMEYFKVFIMAHGLNERCKHKTEDVMKKLLLLTGILIAFTSAKAEAQRYGGNYGYADAQVSFNYFYNTLSPYGNWIEIEYGVYVWKPRQTRYGWQPYSEGRWVYTNHGWHWDSYEPYGWAVYHYGRWYYDDYYGWVWVPGYEWAPAWVEWRYSDAYIGWAPLPPYAGFKVNVGITFSIGWKSHYRHWRFVKYGNFCSPRVHHHYVHVENNYNIYNNTKYRTNYYARNGRIYNEGIRREEVERRGGFRLAERNVSTTDNLYDYTRSRNPTGDGVKVYKPSQSEVDAYRNSNSYKVERSVRKSSLKTDKIAVNRDVTRNKSVTTDRDVDVNRYQTDSRSRDVDIKTNRTNSSFDNNKTNRTVEKNSASDKTSVNKRYSEPSKTNRSSNNSYNRSSTNNRSTSVNKSGSRSSVNKSSGRSSSSNKSKPAVRSKSKSTSKKER